MLNVRFIRVYGINNGYIYFGKNPFVKKFKDVDELIGFFKNILKRKKGGLMPIFPFNLLEDIGENNMQIFKIKYDSIFRKYRKL